MEGQDVEENAKELIEELEERRNSRVVVFFCGDRSPLVAQITDEAIRPLYDHLKELSFEKRKKVIDLLLYGTDGDVGIPWKLVALVREFCDELNVLVPAKARGAATLIALGADEIVMGRRGELSPIDPCLSRTTGPVHLESDRRAFLKDVGSFLKGLSPGFPSADSDLEMDVWNKMVDRIGPLNIGRISRDSDHIRLVIGKLLGAGKNRRADDWCGMIADVLASRNFSHGHGIGRAEAEALGLPVETPKTEDEELLWSLYLIYERALSLSSPIVPERELDAAEEKLLQDLPVSVIESSGRSHRLFVDLLMRKVRDVPPSPGIDVNLKLALPSGIDPERWKSQMKAVLQGLQPHIQQSVHEIVQRELVRQSPVTGLDLSVIGGEWRRTG